jgi:hypothetical protein
VTAWCGTRRSFFLLVSDVKREGTFSIPQLEQARVPLSRLSSDQGRGVLAHGPLRSLEPEASENVVVYSGTITSAPR